MHLGGAGSGLVHAQGDGGGVAVATRLHGQHGRRAAAPVDAVGRVADVGPLAGVVRGLPVNGVDDVVGEEQLPRVLHGAGHVHLDVDVHGAAGVPPREDRLERGQAGGVAHLGTAQERLLVRGTPEARVLATGVAVPD